MNRDQALDIAIRWVARLQPYTERIEIAGSIKREKPDVKDIDIVCAPAWFTEPDMFNEPVKYNALNRYIAESGIILALNGDRQKQIITGEDIKIELWIVQPPAQWGVISLIRTGSSDYAHNFVTPKRQGGLLPSNMKVAGGALWQNSKVLLTPEEIDVFHLAGVPWVEPRERIA